MGKFEGKTILITGTSKGIGRALMNYFCDEGGKVVSVSRTKLSKKPSSVIEISSDIIEVDTIEKQLFDQNIFVNILINNAGVICYENLLALKREEIERVFTTNVTATLMLSQMIAKHMIRFSIQGNIINTLSFAANIPSIGSGIYAASKAALASLTKTMAAELAPYNIRVNGYSPGVVETDMTMPAIRTNREKMLNAIALHELASTEQMTKIVAFLASDDSSYLTGINLDASGGKYIVQNAEVAWKGKDNGK